MVNGQQSRVSRKRIYLDYAATTPLDPRVKRAMEPYFAKEFGNPSSIHAEGVAAKKVLDVSRTTVARALEAHADEIVFTSGGTEANNLAIFGALIKSDFVSGKRSDLVKPHIVTTTIEHTSVLEPLRALEKAGKAEVTYVPVEPNGIVKPEKVIAAIKPNTALVSVMYANNEIGTIQPTRTIGQLLVPIRNSKFILHNSPNEKRYPVFHSDACQAPLYLRCLVNALGVDILSLDAHKIYGPKGVGALYVRRGTPLSPTLFGGGQERGLRSTTENVPAIVGFSEALRIAIAERDKESTRIQKLRDRLYSLIRPPAFRLPVPTRQTGERAGANKRIDAVVNGSMEKGERLPNNLNISLPGTDTEMLTLQLDAAGIAVATKSSCLRDERESYVVKALDPRDKRRARSTLRFTCGRDTSMREVKCAAETLVRLLGEKH